MQKEISYDAMKLVKEALKKCYECCINDKKRAKSSNFIETSFPGERIGLDLLEVRKNSYIAVAIDYFSRFAFAKVIKSKKVTEILKFLDYVASKFEFKTINADNGREFNNNLIRKWVESKGIKIDYGIPHYHKSNGRIERFNRTLRDGLKKNKGSL
ncbi:Retrovirus-related Pol polyprotein from transposon gypsy [Dictyocoela roeselum]|nr:Retrovirus-related Pol polyprotein from transposon gypsy [Dictyocoela roeselum]